MRLNPLETPGIALAYQRWAETQRTECWEALGHRLAAFRDLRALRQFRAAYLSTIPAAHLDLAYADARARYHRKLIQSIRP